MSFPKELKGKKQWVCWRFEPDLNGGKPKKVPINPITGKGAMSNNPDTWTDYETAGNAASGKMNWGKPSAVWEEYVAGLDPTDANSRLVANIGLTNGVPYISWTPDLNTNGIIRTYKIYGSETLENGGNWQYPTNSLHRFFRVKVEMP